jgi:hypothetical protein
LVLGKRPKGRAATEYVAPIFLAWALSELNEPDKTRALLQRKTLLTAPENDWYSYTRSPNFDAADWLIAEILRTFGEK